MATVTIEKRRRGAFGWIVAALFWAWNAIMALWVVLGVNGATVQYTKATGAAAQTGTAVGGAIGFGMVLILWALGTVILGAMMAFTRGCKVLVTTQT